MQPVRDRLRSLARIMLVDDNPFDNEFHTVVLRKAGFEGDVIVFETGEEALAYFAAGDRPAVDLLFLDINLPGASGFEVARMLVDLPASARLALVMLTSSPDARDVAQAKEIAFVRAFLTKPLGVQSVDDVVARCFG